MRDELVEGFAANDLLKVVDEVEPLLVGYLTVDILRVDVVMADDELGVFVILTEVFDRVLCI